MAGVSDLQRSILAQKGAAPLIHLVNPVPTSGQVREIRRRIRRHLPPSVARAIHEPRMLEEPTDVDVSNNVDAAEIDREAAGEVIDRHNARPWTSRRRLRCVRSRGPGHRSPLARVWTFWRTSPMMSTTR